MRVLLLLALVGASASAQPLTITPSPFDASGTAPLMMRNATALPVRLDSLRFGRTVNGYSGVGWSVYYTIDTPSGQETGFLYCPITFRKAGGYSACPYGGDLLFGQQIVPGGALTVRQLALACGACAQPAVLDDTLFVFTDGSAVPQPVEILNGDFVAGEEQPETTRLAVFPNPASRLVRVTLTRAEASRVTVSDALGRTVALIDGARGALEVDVSAWPPGVYTVRAEAPGRAAAVRFVVAR